MDLRRWDYANWMSYKAYKWGKFCAYNGVKNGYLTSLEGSMEKKWSQNGIKGISHIQI